VHSSPVAKREKTFLKNFAKGVDFRALKRYNAQKGNGVFGQNAQRPRFTSDRQRRLFAFCAKAPFLIFFRKEGKV